MWGTIFSAYPNLQIVHCASHIHSNVNPISRLQWRVPYQEAPTVDTTQHISLELSDNPLRDMYSEFGEKFEEKLLNVTSKCVNSTIKTAKYSHTALDSLEISYI